VSFVTGSELDSLRRICSLYRAPLSPLPDHIPPEFYFYELTTQEEKEAREKVQRIYEIDFATMSIAFDIEHVH
jgi:hypothetical protein